jgi:sialate O-acetylesterase
LAFSLICTVATAAVSVPSLFTDHMVLQRDLKNPVWGKAAPGEPVTVEIAGQTHRTTADETGGWSVVLDPLPAGGSHELVIRGENTLTLSDVLVGEVWFCSGQSNMQWPVSNSNHAEVEIASANFPEIRLLTIPLVGRQEAQDDFESQWTVCSPKTVSEFSAVGYFFGRRLHHALGVPVGLIDNAWGGSSAEAWVPREVLKAFPRYEAYIASNDKQCEGYTDAVHAQKIAEWKGAMAEWEKNGAKDRKPHAPRDPRYNQHRPGNIYNGMIHPTIGYGMRGFIWYQGESNAGRAKDYAHLFPLMIQTLRDKWSQGDFPFYWVQLADFQSESPEPQDHSWAHLREAQTKTLDALPNTGQAVIIDAGEGRDIHPRDKQTVANRLARIALARDYGYDMSYQSPRFTEKTTAEGQVLLRFSPVSGGGLYAFDTPEVKGFAIAGEDQQFVWAEAAIVGKDQVKVWSEAVPNPVAVRYAWGVNPVCNLYDRNGLPVTPFRTDEW